MTQWKDQFAVEGTSGGYFARSGDLLRCYLRHWQIPRGQRNILWMGAEREMREVLNKTSFLWQEHRGQQVGGERPMNISEGFEQILRDAEVMDRYLPRLGEAVAARAAREADRAILATGGEKMTIVDKVKDYYPRWNYGFAELSPLLYLATLVDEALAEVLETDNSPNDDESYFVIYNRGRYVDEYVTKEALLNVPRWRLEGAQARLVDFYDNRLAGGTIIIRGKIVVPRPVKHGVTEWEID